MEELSDEKILEMYLSNDLNQEIYKTLDKNGWTTPQKKNFFEIVFKVLDVIYYYEWSWIKKWDYLKSYIAQFSPEYQKAIVFFADEIAEKRLDVDAPDKKTLFDFLKDIDYRSNTIVDDSIFETQVIGRDMKKIVEGFCHVRGFVKSQDEIVADFISQNETEIRKQLIPKTIISSYQDLQKRISSYIKEYIKHDIEKDGGYRYLWRDDTPLREIDSQPFLKILLNKYCLDSNIYIAREPKVGNGNVDFTFTDGKFKICLEIKNAHHDEVDIAINTQLPEYMDGDKTKFGIYLVLWYKSMYKYPLPKKFQSIDDLKLILINNIPKGYNIDVIIIDCNKPIQPSRIKTTRV